MEKFRFSKVMPFILGNTTIGVLYTVPSSIVNCTLEALRSRSRVWDHTFSQTEFAKDDIVDDSVDRNSMSFFEEGGTDVGSQGSNSSKICINRLIIKTSRLTLSVVD